MDTAEKKHLAAAYLDPELLSEQEAKETLMELGYDVDAVEAKGEAFLKRMHAKEALAKGRKEKEEFLTLVDTFSNTRESEAPSGTPYAFAARKGNGEADLDLEKKNAALFKELKKRKKDKE